MKIGIVTTKILGASGIAYHVRKLAKWLKKMGHDVEIITTPYLNIKNLSNISALISITAKILTKKILRESDIDLIHVHHILTYFPGKLLAKPIVLSLHGDILKQYNILHPWAISLIKYLERAAVLRANDVTAVSKYIAKTYQKRYGRSINYVPNAIDLEDIPHINHKDEKTVIFLGRLSYEKGIDILLKAAKLLEVKQTNIKFKIIGEGPLHNMVSTYSFKYKNIIYLGYKPHMKALKELCRSKVLVLPSRAEGLPTVVLEAFACRTAVIASNIPELQETFKDNEIIFFERDSANDLIRKIELLIDNHSLWKIVTKMAYERLLKEYLWSKVIRKYINIYRRVLA